MAFDLSNLETYVDENRFDLISKTVFHAPSIQLFNVQTGIKCTARLNILTVDVEFQDCACSFNPAGEQVFTARDISVACIKVMDSLCDNDLICYFTQKYVRSTKGKESMGQLESIIVNDVINKTLSKLDTAIYQGDTDSADENFNKFDGLLKILDNEADSIKVVADSTTESIYETLLNVYAAIPTTAYDRGDVAILMGYDNYRKLMIVFNKFGVLVNSETTTNIGEREINGIPSFILPGFDTRVYAVKGLDGTNRVIATSLDNIYYGTDYVNDAEELDFWYSKDNQEYRYAIQFYAGVQVAFPDEVVIGTFAITPSSVMALPVDIVNQPIQTTTV